MTYELAKQLKDAGFPTHYHFIGDHPYPVNVVYKSEEADNDDMTPEPTLSELIEACIKLMKPKQQFPTHYNFFSLYPLINTTQSGDGIDLGDIKQWGAGNEYGQSLDDIEWRRNYFGNTPEEAVAKLWIELNKDNLNK